MHDILYNEFARILSGTILTLFLKKSPSDLSLTNVSFHSNLSSFFLNHTLQTAINNN
jgi:hypothetical protein